ncbi:hypothetical protein D9M68_761080 [compost metagenome]
MLMVTRFCSPPYSASDSASAVSVLPTPEGPHSRNTPTGLLGLSSRARAVRMRREMVSSASGCATTRADKISPRRSTDCASSRTMRPMGMPVQSATTVATACASTAARMSGVSPCSFTSWSCASLSSARMASGVRSGSAGGSSSLLSSACTGTAAGDSSLRSATMRSTSAASSTRRCSSSASSACAAVTCAAMSSTRWCSPTPIAASRPAMPDSMPSTSMRRFKSSSAAGSACWLSATRAHAVSSRLTALSGSWRAGM